MIKKESRTVFITSDSCEWPHETEARKWQLELDIKNWADEHAKKWNG